LVAIYHPDDYDPCTEDEAMSRDDLDEALAWGLKAAVACRGTPVELTEDRMEQDPVFARLVVLVLWRLP
jgi:hypothetical protein